MRISDWSSDVCSSDLDAQGDSRWIGKPTGKDAAAGKATFVSILGADRARAQAGLLVEQAIRALDVFDEKADLLMDAARDVVARPKSSAERRVGKEGVGMCVFRWSA